MNKALIADLKNIANSLEGTNRYLWQNDLLTEFEYTPAMEAGFKKIAEGFDEVIKALEEQEK